MDLGSITKVQDLVKAYDEIIKRLAPYTPDVKKIEFDYLNKTSKLKLRINVPSGLKRKVRDIEIPAYENYAITELLDDSFNTINIKPQLKDGKWIIDANQLPASENFLVVMDGKISEEIVKSLVRIDAPEDPIRNEETDEYWVHSAIRDVGLLEEIYRELNIDNVQATVSVGVERTFSSSAPNEIVEFLSANATANAALNQKDRQNLFKQWDRYRSAKRKVGNLQAYQIFELVRHLVEPERFRIYVNINKPFKVHSVSAEGSKFVPESIKVNVLTELSKKLPAADGNLIFKKRDFSDNVQNEFKSLMTKDSKKKTTKS